MADYAGLLSTTEAATRRCAVFLAPPGAGKTFELRALAGGWSGGAVRISLGGPGDDSSHLSKIEKALHDLRDRGALLALDSLDETRLTVSALTELIDDVAARLPEVAHLALACRSAGWLPSVEGVLRRHFGSGVEVFVLQPLTDDDVSLYARAAGVNGDAFLAALRGSRVADLARTPHTLSLLVREYRSAGGIGAALPGSQRELFERSCRRMASESADRLDPRQPSDADRLLVSARRLATLSLFSGRRLFTLSDAFGPDHLTRADCGVDDYASVLGTALFDTAGEDQLAFTHQSVAEFLAAEHLIGTGLPLESLQQLLHGRGGRLAPQVQAVAAWLVAIAPERFGALLEHDPEAFIRSGVELTGPDYRKILLDGLFVLAQSHELLRIHELDVAGLHYDGVEQRLRSVLADPSSSQEACYLAIRSARRMGLADLEDALVATALDSRRLVPTRSAAGTAALDLAPPKPDSPLLALAGPDLASDDHDDELLAVGLKAHLGAGRPASEVLRLLRDPSDPDLIGTYWSVLVRDLPRHFEAEVIPASELSESLRWAIAAEPSADDWSRERRGLWAATEELHDAILACGLRQLFGEGVLAAVADLLAQRLDTFRRLPRHRGTRLPSISDSARRTLLTALRDRGLEDVDLRRLVQAGVLKQGDLPQPSWAARPLPEEEGDEDEEEVLPEALTEVQLQQHMADALRLEAEEAFPAFCFWAGFTPGSADATHQSFLRVARLPGWELCDQVRRDLVLAAARVYLASAAEPSIGDGAFSAARALVLLSEEGDRPELPDLRWRSLARSFMTQMPSVSDEAALTSSLRWIYTRARRTLLDAAVEAMRREPDVAQFSLRRLAPVLTAEDAPWVRWLVTDPVTDMAAMAFACETLVRLDIAAAIRLVPGVSLDRRRALGTALLRRGGPDGWPVVRELISGDRNLAVDIIGDLAEHSEGVARPLDEDQAAELWSITDDLFPRDGDPVVHGTHSASRRESVAIMRDRMLPTLADRGTPEAVAALREIASARPDEPMYKRIVALAKAARARFDWHPLAPAEILGVIAHTDAVAPVREGDEVVPEQQPFQVDGWNAVSVVAGLGLSALIALVVWARDGFEVVGWNFAIAFGVLGVLGVAKRIRWPTARPERFVRPALVFVAAAAASTGIVALAQRDENSDAPSARPSPVSSAAAAPSTEAAGLKVAKVKFSVQEVAPGGSVTVSGSGFLPGEIVRVELFPGSGLQNFNGPYQVGDFPADSDGVLSPTAVTVHEEICCAGATVRMNVTGRTSHRLGTGILTLK